VVLHLIAEAKILGFGSVESWGKKEWALKTAKDLRCG
jgi:hypothetical protein